MIHIASNPSLGKGSRGHLLIYTIQVGYLAFTGNVMDSFVFSNPEWATIIFMIVMGYAWFRWDRDES
jgi:hypothetical protein